MHKEKEQLKYKSYYDAHHKTVDFKIGSAVWVHFGLPEVGLTHKLLPRFDGPYEILEKLDQVTYRVTDQARMFPVHVQRMLPYYTWE